MMDEEMCDGDTIGEDKPVHFVEKVHMMVFYLVIYVHGRKKKKKKDRSAVWLHRSSRLLLTH
jgi:hypothetical protein